MLHYLFLEAITGGLVIAAFDLDDLEVFLSLLDSGDYLKYSLAMLYLCNFHNLTCIKFHWQFSPFFLVCLYIPLDHMQS